jgi:hypothetical protein
VRAHERPEVEDPRGPLALDALLELVQLQPYHGVLRVAAAVVPGEDLCRLVSFSPHRQPAGGFWDEEAARDDEERRDELQRQREAEG